MMTGDSPFHADWQPRPWWWEATPPLPADGPLPEAADAVVVGSGYCGLFAARVLAFAGRSVLVLDAGHPGSGASTRNDGLVGSDLMLTMPRELGVGPERAAAIRKTSYDSFGFIAELVRAERLDVDYEETGRFFGAHSPGWFKWLKAKRDDLEHFGYHARMVPRDLQHSEVCTSYYHGGMVVERSAIVHPAKLYSAVLGLAQRAGVSVFGNTTVQNIRGVEGAMAVRTSRGTVHARNVLLAANAYVGRFSESLSPYLRRRIIPMTTYLMATEELPEGLTHRLIPTNRMGGDTQRSGFAFRLSPDGKRVIFNGRPWHRSEIGERAATPSLHKQMCKVWPDLRGIRITHTWKSLFGFTVDQLPRLGVQDGVTYAAGCNGIAMMSYLGHQMALKLVNNPNRQCGLDGLPFPSRPGYTGEPWFLPAVGASQKLLDAAERAWPAGRPD